MNNPNMINPNPQPMANAGFNQPQFRNIPIILVNSMEDVKAYKPEQVRRPPWTE